MIVVNSYAKGCARMRQSAYNVVNQYNRMIRKVYFISQIENRFSK